MKKIFLTFLLLTLKVCASEEILEKSQEIADVLSKNAYEPNYFSMILGLFLVVGLIYLTGFLYQKLTKANSINENLCLNKAQVISTTSIGQGRNLHIVKIGDSACLIGSTQNNITYLKDVELLDNNKNKDKNNGKSC